MYKLIACDVDGTLLMPGCDSITPKQIVQINNLCNMGVHFVVASGRSYGELCKLFSPVCSLVTFICNDGAQLISHGKTLYDLPCKTDSIKDIYSFCRKENLNCMFFLRDNITDDINKVNINNVYKIYIGDISKEQIDRIKSVLPYDLFIGYSSNDMIELLPSGVDKSIALTAYMKFFNIDKSESISFGDNFNDYYMLTCTARSFRMTNSKVDLSGVANEVTDSVYDTIDSLFFRKV